LSGGGFSLGFGGWWEGFALGVFCEGVGFFFFLCFFFLVSFVFFFFFCFFVFSFFFLFFFFLFLNFFQFPHPHPLMLVLSDVNANAIPALEDRHPSASLFCFLLARLLEQLSVFGAFLESFFWSCPPVKFYFLFALIHKASCVCFPTFARFPLTCS